jgi:potassium-transporting ATPase potassium-binding subunit
MTPLVVLLGKWLTRLYRSFPRSRRALDLWRLTTIGFVMLFGRFFTLPPMLDVAGFLAAKKSVPEGLGTLPTATPIFTILLVTVLLVGGPTFFPTLALGPIVEHLMLSAGQLF